MFLIRCQAVPVTGRYRVAAHPLALFVKFPKAVLSVGVSRFCSLLIEPLAFLDGFDHAFTSTVHHAKVILGSRIATICSLTIPAEGLLIILRHSFASMI